MLPVRCPNCNRSFILIGIDDFRTTFELVLYCINCEVSLQFEMQREQDTDDDDAPGQYL